ncbi:MAG: hypothetical protein V5B60_20735 [Accumulibacter sp.]|uniref:hypothetical protein n=1 Tax=Accumulibacter sp. TaxID=2053492 RepID=UPI002FC3C18E
MIKFLNVKIFSANIAHCIPFWGFVSMAVLSALLSGCSKPAASLLDLSCDARCENLYITISTPAGGTISTVLNAASRAWNHIVTTEGVNLSYLSGETSNDLVATNGSEVLSVNFNDRSYQTLYQHTAEVFYPTKSDGCLYFSESTTRAHGARNPDQGRILWKFDPADNALLQGLRPWVAYQIGRPFIISHEWIYLDLILPSKSLANSEDSPAAHSYHALKSFSAYRFNLKSAFSAEVSQEVLVNGRVFPGRMLAEQISLDKGGNYIAFYSLSDSPSRWIVYDTKLKSSVVSVTSKGRDRLVVSPDGSKYAHVLAKGSSIDVSIGDLPGSSQSVGFSISIEKIRKAIIERK